MRQEKRAGGVGIGKAVDIGVSGFRLENEIGERGSKGRMCQGRGKRCRYSFGRGKKRKTLLLYFLSSPMESEA